jgi:uncharacterized protein YndB with AHSA1/START domain
MAKSEFIYTTYIKTTPQKLWKALTNSEFIKQYWAGCDSKTDWKPGSEWQLIYPDGKIVDSGEVIEAKPYKRLAIKWRNEWNPEYRAEGYSRCVMDIEPSKENSVKLTVTHSIGRDKSKLIKAVSGGWPFVLSNLKSLLETGKVVMKNYR